MSRSIPLLLALSALVGTEAGAQLVGPPPPRSALEVGVDGHNARVLSAREGTIPPDRTVILAGLGATYRTPGSRLEFGARLRKSTLAEDLAFGDVTVARYFGALAGEIGAGWRRGYDASTGALHGATHPFVRLGAAWRATLEATPVTLEARFGAFLPFGQAELPGGALSGWDGESTMRLAIGATAFDGLLGFRFERFEVDGTVQEVSHLRAGVVWRRGVR